MHELVTQRFANAIVINSHVSPRQATYDGKPLARSRTCKPLAVGSAKGQSRPACYARTRRRAWLAGRAPFPSRLRLCTLLPVCCVPAAGIGLCGQGLGQPGAAVDDTTV